MRCIAQFKKPPQGTGLLNKNPTFYNSVSLLKAGIGVHKWSRSSPILKALNIKKIETTIDISSLDLGRSILCNGSRARSFYIYLMNMRACGQLNGHNYLVSRISKTCDKHNVSFLKYVLMKITPAMYLRKNMFRTSHDGLMLLKAF